MNLSLGILNTDIIIEYLLKKNYILGKYVIIANINTCF